jgi:hypothetical protein
VKSKKLFLESCLINLLAATIATATLIASSSQTQGLSLIARILVGVIASVYAVAAIYATRVCWKIDAGATSEAMVHSANNVAFAANECPYVGLLGSVAGIFIFMSSALSASSDLDKLKESSMMGIGVAFVPTIVGVFARIMLSWQHHIILQALEHPEKRVSIFEQRDLETRRI